jgi:hypothetical protein
MAETTARIITARLNFCIFNPHGLYVKLSVLSNVKDIQMLLWDIVNLC